MRNMDWDFSKIQNRFFNLYFNFYLFFIEVIFEVLLLPNFFIESMLIIILDHKIYIKLTFNVRSVTVL